MKSSPAPSRHPATLLGRAFTRCVLVVALAFVWMPPATPAAASFQQEASGESQVATQDIPEPAALLLLGAGLLAVGRRLRKRFAVLQEQAH